MDMLRPGKDDPRLVCLAEIQSRPVQWLWPDRIPLGMLTLLAGDPGLGKTWVALDIIARVTRGMQWPDAMREGDPPAPCGSAILLTAEDALSDTIKPRLEFLGADPAKVFVLKGTAVQEGRRHILNIIEDLPVLERVLRQLPDVRLVVFDPISAYLGGTDSHRNAKVQMALGGLSDLAERFGVAILAISHRNKNSDLQAIYRVIGSPGLTAARAVWTITRDKEDPDLRLLLPLKINVCWRPPGLSFSFFGGTLAWESTCVLLTAEEALADISEEEHFVLTEAMAWLDNALAKGRVLSTEILAMAARQAIPERTLRRAKVKLGVGSHREGFGPAALWYWDKGR
jgi:putative DNA primase/helicase